MNRNSENLRLEGNAFYEIDQDCIRKKKEHNLKTNSKKSPSNPKETQKKRSPF